MKKVLFMGTTNYNLEKPHSQRHLKKKFEGLTKGIEVFVLAKGRPFHKKIWNSDFYLLPPNFLFWPKTFFLAFYLCLKKKVNTIVCQSPLLDGLIGTFLKKILKKELIVEVHGDWIEAPFLYKKRWPKIFWQKIFKILGNISLRNADKIRAISSFTNKLALKIAPKKPYFVFPTFTDLDLFFNEKEIKFDNFILFIGQLERVKGVEYLIKAFSKISNEFPNLKLILVGEGSERKNLESKVKSLGLEDKVEFKGKLSLEQTKNIMKICYCLVLPSLSEGLGRVLMEAEALGKPVIGSKVGGIPDLVKDGENGFLFEPGNINRLAEKLKILLKDKNLTIEMGQKGRAFVREKFSNQKYIENHLKMIYH